MLARAAVQEGAGIVVACGGDGTVGEVASGLMGSGAALALLPLGTGNDLARHLGLFDLKTAIDSLLSGETKPLDAVRWQIGEEEGSFVNVAGAGFDAFVADRINTGFRYLRGTSAYVAAVIDTLRKFKACEMTVTVDGRSHRVKAMLCAIANASSYGGGMRISPNSDSGDGLLEVVLVQEVSHLEFLRTFPKVFDGKHLVHPAVKVVQGRSVLIESTRPIPVLCDGELEGMTPAQFRVVPSALKVVARP